MLGGREEDKDGLFHSFTSWQGLMPFNLQWCMIWYPALHPVLVLRKRHESLMMNSFLNLVPSFMNTYVWLNPAWSAGFWCTWKESLHVVVITFDLSKVKTQHETKRNALTLLLNLAPTSCSGGWMYGWMDGRARGAWRDRKEKLHCNPRQVWQIAQFLEVSVPRY